MKNNRALLISLIVVVALFIGAIVIIPQLSKTGDSGSSETAEVDLSKYDTAKFIDANDDNGQIADHVHGDISKAKVVIIEYADYQCTGCATVTPWMEQLVNEYNGDFAIIYRSYPLTNIHPNAIAAASAVEAAGLQGYWEEYGDLVFDNQAEWFYSTGNNRTNYFVSYFESITKGTGDVAKFKSDMASDAVKAKVNFDKTIAESLKLDSTPSFFDYDGKEIDWITDTEQTKTGIQNFFRNYINQRLGK